MTISRPTQMEVRKLLFLHWRVLSCPLDPPHLILICHFREMKAVYGLHLKKMPKNLLMDMF